MLSASPHSLPLRSVYRAGSHGRAYHWYEAGDPDAPPLVLVHGYMAHAMTFRRIVGPLARSYRLLIPDLPAHGRDDTFRATGVAPTIDSLHDWLSDWMGEVAGGEPVHLLGHSLGATISYYVGRDGLYPLSSVTLVNPGLRISDLSWGRHILERLPSRLAAFGASRLGFAIYEPIQWRGEPMNQRERESYLGPLQQPERLDFMLRLGSDLLREPDRLPAPTSLGAPTLLLWGTQDHMLRRAHASHIQQMLEGCRLDLIDDAGHCPMEDRPEHFARRYLAFLDSLRAGPADGSAAA